MNTLIDTSRHPCFNEESRSVCGRVHLPVAPKCNIKCNYCDRKYDCANENRPGVSSAVLSPDQAVAYLDRVLEMDPRISVVGIAGPGDPLANPDETFTAMERIREKHPELLFCLSTNGLALPEYVDTIAALGVSHITVTVNAVDHAISEAIYPWVRDGKVIHRGREAGALLWERQRAGISALKEIGVVVKVNMILIPGLNDHHVEDVAREMASMGVDVLNVMAMVPNEGTAFGERGEPGHYEIAAARAAAEKYLPQMKHCRRCRADAAGLLGEDQADAFARALMEAATTLDRPTEDRPYVAVATREGILVNQHLGEAEEFQVWKKEGESFRLMETRTAPERGGGPGRWRELASILSDCRAVLSSGYGQIPGAILRDEGLLPVQMSGFIELGLSAVHSGRDLGAFKKRKSGECAKGLSCGGDGGGCG